MRVAVLPNHQKPEAIHFAQTLCEKLCALQIEPVVEEVLRTQLPKAAVCKSVSELKEGFLDHLYNNIQTPFSLQMRARPLPRFSMYSSCAITLGSIRLRLNT